MTTVSFADLSSPNFPGFCPIHVNSSTETALIEPELYNQWKEKGFEGRIEVERIKSETSGKFYWKAVRIV